MNVTEIIERFLKRKKVKEILGDNYKLSDNQYKRISKLFEQFNSTKEFEDYNPTIANFIKYDVIAYKSRLRRIKKCSNHMDLYAFFLRYGKNDGFYLYQKVNVSKTGHLQTKISFWESLGFTTNDAKIKVKEFQTKQAEKAAKKLKGSSLYTCRSKEFWKFRGYSEKDASDEVRRIQERSKSFFIQKYGNEEGLKRYNIKKDKFNKSWSNKTHEELELINKKKDITSPEGFILRGYSEKDAIKLSNEMSKRLVNRYSAISQKFFDDIVNYLNDNTLEFYYGTCNHEYCIYNKRVDFFEKTTGTVIEFFGDYWHGNPKFYCGTDIIRTKKVFDLWERDKKRIDHLNNSDMIKSLIIVWENNVRTKYDEQVVLISNIIKGNIKYGRRK